MIGLAFLLFTEANVFSNQTEPSIEDKTYQDVGGVTSDQNKEKRPVKINLPSVSAMPDGLNIDNVISIGYEISENAPKEIGRLNENDTFEGDFVKTRYRSNDPDVLVDLYVTQSPGSMLPPWKVEWEKSKINGVTVYFESFDLKNTPIRYYFMYEESMYNVGGTNISKEELRSVVSSILD
ncbi:hypothetical protein BKP45_15290 [Anaerobacillus alkalidiazotrophicus]|uniref:DUF4367 domain-containing protein n=1 Tax=Anaerobacillus alkalidiazotrophicus TaxID=472963 RepID=A0A1S2M2Y6_9BACI|nr:hypothetical protein [Anaerobacillus alkalidiazotrophicus]OIJ18890.1 hypothetical protein BKP45_15290 [Anaerobacillus alkalidiazotrophicus]